MVDRSPNIESQIDLTSILPLSLLKQILNYDYNNDIASLNINCFLASRERILHAIIDKNIDLTKAQKIITQLNNRIREKCHEIYLSLIYQCNGHQVLDSEYISLNLMAVGRKTIKLSDISFTRYDDRSVVIYSKTAAKYRRRGYNKLLRAVLILIAPHIIFNKYYKPRYVISNAINVISVVTLYKYFEVSFNNTDFNNYIAAFDIEDIETQKDYLIKIIRDYLREKDDNYVDVVVPLSDYNILKATAIIDDMIPVLRRYFERITYVHTFNVSKLDIHLIQVYTPDGSYYYLQAGDVISKLFPKSVRLKRSQEVSNEHMYLSKIKIGMTKILTVNEDFFEEVVYDFLEGRLKLELHYEESREFEEVVINYLQRLV